MKEAGRFEARLPARDNETEKKSGIRISSSGAFRIGYIAAVTKSSDLAAMIACQNTTSTMEIPLAVSSQSIRFIGMNLR